MSLGPVWVTWIDSVFKVSKKKSISTMFILRDFNRTVEPTVERKNCCSVTELLRKDIETQ